MDDTPDSFSKEKIDALYRARQRRLREVMRRMGVPAVLVTDPVNILYATGARNMTVFAMRSTTRYLLLFADGPAILFEYYGCEHLAQGLPTLDEIRPATGVSFIAAGPDVDDAAARWAGEISALVWEHAGKATGLAVDRFHFTAIDALRAQGFRLSDADQVFAEARRIKLPEEIPFIREAVHRVEAAAHELAESIEPGFRETDVWAAFHRGFIAREGEYVTTRLIAGGARTFPYFQECSTRPLGRGELLCFDTDALGFMGYAVDFSRTFLCGDKAGTPEQRHLYRLARDQLDWNVELFQPGRHYREIAESAWPIPEPHRTGSYYCIAHGLGMSGEHPNIPHTRPHRDYPLDGVVEPGMVLCVESYIGSPESHQGVKLEDQLLITATGPVRLSGFPFEERLLDTFV